MINLPHAALFLALSIFSSVQVQSATQRNVCGDLEDAIDATLKSISLIKAERLRAKGESQEQIAQLKLSNELTTIEQNLRLMQQNSCRPWTFPIRTNAYFVEAVECVNASKRGDKEMSACDTTKWKR
jgi:hypothetical protein